MSLGLKKYNCAVLDFINTRFVSIKKEKKKGKLELNFQQKHTTVDPWTTGGLGRWHRPPPVNSGKSAHNFITYFQFHILRFTQQWIVWYHSTYFLKKKKKSTFKWTHAVQTRVVQGSTAYSFVDYGRHISYRLITGAHY